MTPCTQAVVTPNIVRPMAGLACDVVTVRPPWLIMPASAWAAFDSTLSETLLMPDMSVTEYIMQMSEGPT